MACKDLVLSHKTAALARAHATRIDGLLRRLDETRDPADDASTADATTLLELRNVAVRAPGGAAVREVGRHVRSWLGQLRGAGVGVGVTDGVADVAVADLRCVVRTRASYASVFVPQ